MGLKVIRRFIPKQEHGFIFVSALVVMTFLISAGLAIATAGLSNLASARRSLLRLSALSVAEAGAEEYLQKLNSDTPCADGAVDTGTIFEDDSKGRGVYSVTTNTEPNLPAGENGCELTITGEIYLPASAAQPTATRRISVVARRGQGGSVGTPDAGTGIFDHHLHSLEPIGTKLDLGTANFVDGDIYTTQYFDTGLGSLLITGRTRIQAAGKNIAGCSVSGGGTVKEQYLVRGNFQVEDPLSPCGVSYSGSGTSEENLAGSSQEIQAEELPNVDKASIVDAISATDDCADVESGPGPVHIIKNARYNCDLAMKKDRYLVEGDAYITGVMQRVNVNQPLLIELSEDAVRDHYVIVDGRIDFKSNQIYIRRNSKGYGLIFVSYSSAAPLDCGTNRTSYADQAITITPNPGDLSSYRRASLDAGFLAPQGSLCYGFGSGHVYALAARKINLYLESGATYFIPHSQGIRPRLGTTTGFGYNVQAGRHLITAGGSGGERSVLGDYFINGSIDAANGGLFSAARARVAGQQTECSILNTDADTIAVGIFNLRHNYWGNPGSGCGTIGSDLTSTISSDTAILPTTLPTIDKNYILSGLGDRNCSSFGGGNLIEPGKYDNCDVTLSTGQTYTVKGDVWISGRFNVPYGSSNNNGIRIKVDESLDRDVYFLVEDKVIFHGGSFPIYQNKKGAGIVFVSYSSANTNCGGEEDAIDLSNFSTGGTEREVDASFYAVNGGLCMRGHLNPRALAAGFDITFRPVSIRLQPINYFTQPVPSGSGGSGGGSGGGGSGGSMLWTVHYYRQLPNNQI